MARERQAKPKAASTASPKAIGYVRVSTERQAERGLSIEAQREAIERYCAVHEIELVGVEIDDGYSGKSLERPAAKRAIGRLRSGEANTLVVLKLDRMTRSTRDLYHLIEDVFEPLHASFQSVQERIDTSSAAGRVLVAMLGVLAQFEREQTAERVRLAMDHLRAKGVALGQMPYGKRRAPKVNGERYSQIVDDERELEAIGAAIELRSSRKSLRAIASGLDDKGTRPRRAARWGASSVLGLLRAQRARMARRPWSEIDGQQIALEVPLVEHADSANSESKRRDTIRKKMSVKNAIAAALLARNEAPPELPVVVEITIVQGARGKTLDGDNAVARAKGSRDEIARWLGCDDKEGRGVDEWIVRIDRAKAPAMRVVIRPSRGGEAP